MSRLVGGCGIFATVSTENNNVDAGFSPPAVRTKVRIHVNEMTLDEQIAYLAKGTVDFIDRDDLKKKIARGKPLTVKVGFDATAPDIHLGHTVLMRKMKHFQQIVIALFLSRSPA